jgi:hypothetical protein
LNPCFDDSYPRASADVLSEGTCERPDRRGLLWMAPDVITFVITIPVFGQCLKTIKFAISYRVFQGSHRSAASDHYERNRPEKAQRLADEYEKASRTKPSLRQAKAVLDRLHEELSGERVVRTSLRQYLDVWFEAKRAETTASTMSFYRGSLCKVFAVSRQALE